MNHRPASTACAFAFVAAALGCAEEAAPPSPVTRAAVAAPAAAAPSPAPPPLVPVVARTTAPASSQRGANAPASSPAAPTPQSIAPSAPAADYKPPFPDRKDLFVPPKRQGNVRITDGDREESVVLLGFVRVDRPLAVLSINGEVWSIAEGAALQGIEVISINPPSVVLQQGRQRWQASLEN